MKIGVYGSAAGPLNDQTKEKAQKIGTTIAKNQATLITGGCTGLPHEAVLAAHKENGNCIAFSPAINMESHQKHNYPTTGFSNFVFIPPEYEHANSQLICRKYRNVSSVASVDAAIFISGRIGSMNEFTIAYDLGKTIGILENSGGITKRAIKILLEDINKQTGAQVISRIDLPKSSNNKKNLN